MATNIDRVALVIAESITSDSAPAHEIVADLEHDGLLMPDPQIIRTVEELEAIDPETVVQRYTDHPCRYTRTEAAEDLLYVIRRWGTPEYLPAVVVATAAQVRAARKELEEA